MQTNVRYAILLSAFWMPAYFAVADPFSDHQTLAIVGGTFVERMQRDGTFEAAFQRAAKTSGIDGLSVRNLGWSGDTLSANARKQFGEADDGKERRLKDIQVANADIVMVAYGEAAAIDGGEQLLNFEDQLRSFIEQLQRHEKQIVLVAPVPLLGYRVNQYDQNLRKVCRIIREVGKEKSLVVLEFPRPLDLTESSSRGITANASGYKAVGESMARQLFGLAGSNLNLTRHNDVDLRNAIIEKDRLFFHRYRPQNETYLFLFRKHEQGINADEVLRFDALVEAADRNIWRQVSGGR